MRLLSLIISLLLILHDAVSQENTDRNTRCPEHINENCSPCYNNTKRMYKKIVEYADKNFELGNYVKANNYYQRANIFEPNDVHVNNRMAVISELEYKLDKSTLFIDTLSTNNSYQIIRNSSGCFHSYSDTITITNTSEGFLYESKYCRMTLKDDNLFRYRKFEYELINDFHVGGCTSVDVYMLRTKSETLTINTDDSCIWPGLQLPCSEQ